MSCVKCGKLVANLDYCALCYHCGEVGCLECDIGVIRNCIACHSYNKKITNRIRVIKLIELLKKVKFHKNLKLICVVICNYYISKKDYDEAFKWNLIAANHGEPSAQYYIAVVYFKGYPEVGEVNYKEALRWFELAAANNIISAFKYLGKMYRDGLGVEEDPYKSTTYFTIGAIGKDMKCEDEYFKSFNNDRYGFKT